MITWLNLRPGMFILLSKRLLLDYQVSSGVLVEVGLCSFVLKSDFYPTAIVSSSKSKQKRVDSHIIFKQSQVEHSLKRIARAEHCFGWSFVSLCLNSRQSCWEFLKAFVFFCFVACVFMNYNAAVTDIMTYFISWRAWSCLLSEVCTGNAPRWCSWVEPFPTCCQSWRVHSEGCRRISSCVSDLKVIRSQFYLCIQFHI